MIPSDDNSNERAVRKLYDRMRKLFNRGCVEHSLLSDGDRILVAVSGGKDSLVLVRLLGERARIFKPHLHVEAVHVVMDNISYETDTQWLQRYCDYYGVKLHVLHTHFDERADSHKSPCFLCSWHRRKAIFTFAVEQGFNKVALGHHQDDILITLLMNLTYEGSLSTMRPLLSLEHYPLSVIRPLCLLPESLLHDYATAISLPKQKRLCPHEDQTRRKSMQSIFAQLELLNPEARYSLWHAAFHS